MNCPECEKADMVCPNCDYETDAPALSENGDEWG